MTTIEDKMTLIQSENNQLKEESAILTDVNMQSSLNKIDGDGRAIIWLSQWFPKVRWQFTTKLILKMTKWKSTIYYQNMELDEDESNIENIEITRLGQPKPGVSRLIKVKLQSSADRNKK